MSAFVTKFGKQNQILFDKIKFFQYRHMVKLGHASSNWQFVVQIGLVLRPAS